VGVVVVQPVNASVGTVSQKKHTKPSVMNTSWHNIEHKLKNFGLMEAHALEANLNEFY
jgi:hypothetical protein